jgi:hypothetical protein
MRIIEKASKNRTVYVATIQSSGSVIVVAGPHDKRDVWDDAVVSGALSWHEKTDKPGIASTICRAGLGGE